MQKDNEICDSHRKYTKISTKRRQSLVDKVQKQGLPISKVAKILRINISTAKLILKKYKETGSFFKKKMCKSKYKNQRTAVRPKVEQAPPSLQKQQRLEIIMNENTVQGAGHPFFPYFTSCTYPLNQFTYGLVCQIPYI